MYRKIILILWIVFTAVRIPIPAHGQQAAEPAAAVPRQQPANAPRESAGPANRPNAELSSSPWTLLAQGAASEKARDRSDALSALTILRRDPKAISVIQEALGDKEVSIRVLAATSLGEMKARATIPALRAALDDDSSEVSFTAAQALWKMGDRSGRQILYEVLDGERKTKPSVIKSKVTDMRKQIQDPKSLALLGLNQASGVLLGPFSMGLSFIEEYAKNTGAPVQAYCAQLLAADNSPQTVAELTDALSDKNWTVRAAAARALAELNHKQAIPQLRDMMENDKEQPARFVAAAAILRLGEPTGKVPVKSGSVAGPAGSASPSKK